jgi:hypothetical protein
MALKAQNSKWLNSGFFQAVFMQISMFHSMFDIKYLCRDFAFKLLLNKRVANELFCGGKMGQVQ